jgi:hypothetical protein
LLADLGGRQAAIQPGGLEGGIGLEIVLNQIAEILKEMGQVELGRLTTASREVVRTGDAGVQLMLRLANRIPSPTQFAFGLPLAQAKRLDRFRDESPALSTVERLCRSLQQDTHRRGQFHLATSWLSRWHCTGLSAQLARYSRFKCLRYRRYRCGFARPNKLSVFATLLVAAA